LVSVSYLEPDTFRVRFPGHLLRGTVGRAGFPVLLRTLPLGPCHVVTALHLGKYLVFRVAVLRGGAAGDLAEVGC
jgi:hypothetical protein